MKRFLAFWIVTIVLGALAGFAIGVIDYFFAEIGQPTFDGSTCWDSIFHGGCFTSRVAFLGLNPFFSLFLTVPGYPLVRAVVGSFKIVFGSKD